MLKLSHNVAGVTFLAFGNGAPDIFSALVAFSDPHTAGLALGALFGTSGLAGVGGGQQAGAQRGLSLVSSPQAPACW